jgi:uncharacterized protein (DUF488 family)
VRNEDDLIYTIGHSTQPISSFLELLKANSVSVVADVRSSPFSRYQPQFNRDALQTELKKSGTSYVFLGLELGARSADPNCYIDGRVQYDRLAQAPEYSDGINRLVEGAKSHSIALMCSEKDPLECHRTLLVSKSLVERGFEIEHILADGTLETHDQALTRLLRQLKLPEQDLFRDRSEILAEALKKQEFKIAYIDKNMSAMD